MPPRIFRSNVRRGQVPALREQLLTVDHERRRVSLPRAATISNGLIGRALSFGWSGVPRAVRQSRLVPTGTPACDLAEG